MVRKKLGEAERRQKELLELMSFSLNSLYALVCSKHPRAGSQRKTQLFYETLAKLNREERWSFRKEEFKRLLAKR